MDDHAEQVRAELAQLAHDQMGRWERMDTGRARKAIAKHVAENEHVDLVFGGSIDGTNAMIALSRDARTLREYRLPVD